MSKTLQEMIYTLFEVKTTAMESQVSVAAATVTKVVGNNPNRLSIIVSNPSANGAYLSFKVNMAAGEGILLVPSGGFISYIWDEDFDVVGWGLYALGSGGVATLNVLEIISV